MKTARKRMKTVRRSNFFLFVHQQSMDSPLLEAIQLSDWGRCMQLIEERNGQCIMCVLAPKRKRELTCSNNNQEYCIALQIIAPCCTNW